MESLQKPAFCGQDWQHMTPTTGGRICGKCEKKIVDFSKMSWDQIRQIQAENMHAVCGMYTNKQLENWDQPKLGSTINFKPTLAVTSILFALSQTIGAEVLAQSGATTEVFQSPTDASESASKLADSIPYCILSGTITVKYDDYNKQPLPYASVSIPRLGIGTMSNEVGAYVLKVPLDGKPIAGDVLVVKSIGIIDYEVIISEFTEGPTVLDIETVDTSKFSVFYVTQPTRWQRFKGKIGGWFH